MLKTTDTGIITMARNPIKINLYFMQLMGGCFRFFINDGNDESEGLVGSKNSNASIEIICPVCLLVVNSQPEQLLNQNP